MRPASQSMAGVAQRLCPAASIPWEHLRRFLDMCQTRSLHFRPKVLDKQIGILNIMTGNAFQSAICAVPGSGSRQALSPTVISHGTQEHRPHWPPEPIKGCPLSSSCKKKKTPRKQGTKRKNCVKTPFWEILVLWSVAQGEHEMAPTGWSQAKGKCKDGTC